MISRLFVFLIVVAQGAASLAQEFTLGNLSIMRPWSRELPPVAPNGAAYFRIENRGTEADRIVSAHTPVAERAEIHTHEMDGAMMKMRHVHSVDVPAGGSVAFEPEGLHVMLLGLKEPLVGGKSFPITLVFEKAGQIDVTMEIRGSGASGHSGHESRKH